jgi:hypothetical protein
MNDDNQISAACVGHKRILNANKLYLCFMMSAPDNHTDIRVVVRMEIKNWGRVSRLQALIGQLFGSLVKSDTRQRLQLGLLDRCVRNSRLP